MNLTQMIEETGRRVRHGKVRTEHLSNAQVKLILETAMQVMHEALKDEGRIEIQNFLVIERKITPVKPTPFKNCMRKTERKRWRVRVKEAE